MAVTVAEVERINSLGDYYEKIIDVTFDASYPTGGEALTAGTLGFITVLSAVPEISLGSAVRTSKYDRATAKLLAYAPDGTEVADTTDLSAVTVRLVVKGR